MPRTQRPSLLVLAPAVIAGALLVAGFSDVPPSAAGEASPAITGLKTRIETDRLEETLEFYTNVLGLTVLDSWNEEGDRGAILGIGGSVDGEAFLEVGHDENPAEHGGMSLQFRVADLEPLVGKLDGRYEYRGPVERPWGSTYVYVRDPAGVDVVLYEGEL